METRLCRIVRDLRELKKDAIRFQYDPVGASGIISGYDHILDEIMDMLQVPEKQKELFWILVTPDKE